MFGGIDGRGFARNRGTIRALRALFATILLLATALQSGVVSPVLADPASPLQVTKTANPSPVASGGQLTYTIAIKNTGGAKVDSVVMTDQVNGVGTIQNPPGLPQLTITSTQGPCTQGGPNGNVVACQIGTIPGLGTVTITIRGQVTAANGTSLNNTASVSGTKSAQNFTTNASVSVLVQGGTGGGPLPDLTLNKTGPTSIPPSTNMDYTLTVNNVGTANTANVKVVDTLPSGVTLQLPSPTTPFETTSLFVCTSNASTNNPITVICTGGAVNQGQNATIKIHAISPATTGQITNTSVVDPDNAIAESNELNNASAAVNTNVTTAPPTPLLTIFKTDNNPTSYPWSTGAGPDPVNPGQKLTYKIQVTNAATTRADDVVITDGTQGLEASSIVVSQVVVNGTVGNTGGCFVNAPQVRCSDRTLNPGGTITITITGIVVSSAGANIFNTATVTGNIKNQGVSNTASESTTVRPAVDLTITKSDSPDPVCARSWPQTNPVPPPTEHLANTAQGVAPPASGDIPGIGLLQPPVCLGGLTYHFVVGNSGQAIATGVSIRDPLPAGLIFDSYASSMASLVCGVDGSNVITCNGGTVGPASTETIDFRLVAPPTLGLITNTVTVDPNNAIFEPDETNNDATTTTDVRTGIDLVIFKSDKTGVDPAGGAPPLTEGFDAIATSGTGTYTVIVDNVGTQNATGIKVVDTLPAGTKFLSVTSDQGFTCAHDGSATGGNVTCIGGHLLGTEAEFYQPAGTPPPSAPGDEFATIKIKFFATPFVQPAMHNIVRVDPDNTIDEVNELNNLATDDTVVSVGNDDKGAFNQLTVDKTQVSPASNGPVATNGIVKYNLHVSNLGTDPVSNVVVQDYLPAGSRFISATDVTVASPASAKFFCTHDGSPTGGTITCVGGDFSGSVNTIPGSPVVPIERDISVKMFAPNTPQTAVNTTTVDPANVVAEGNEFDNDAQQTTDVTSCTDQTSCTAENAVYELTIHKTQFSPANPVARNGIVTYDLLVTNLGSDPISGIVVQDTLPQGSLFIDARDLAFPDPHAFTCGSPDANRVLSCTGGVLSGTNPALAIPGVVQFRTIRIRVFAPDQPGTYPNLAIVDPFNTIPEGNEFNNSDQANTDVTNGGNGPYVDLKLEKAQDFPDPATVPTVDTGGQIRYVLTISNLGVADAFNVRVRDVLPQFVTFHNARDEDNTAGQFTCGQTSTGIIDCTGGTIPAGGSRKIEVNVDVFDKIDTFASSQSDVHVLITNQASVDPFNEIHEGDETNNDAFVDTTIKPPINLTLTKDGSDTATQNDTTTYTIKVTNNKTTTDGATAFGVKIVDPLPVGLIPLSVTAEPGNFTCQVEENPVNFVTCIGDLEAGKDVTITIKAFVTQDGGTLDNEACVDPNDTIAETNELDNCKHAIGQVLPPTPDMLINKSADKSSVTPGEELTYTLTASNIGTGDSTAEISVSDSVPSDLTVTDISPDAGWDCSASSGNSVSCKRPDLAKGESSHIIVRTTMNDGVTSPITNTANIIGGGESNAANNTATVTTSVGGAPIDLILSSITDTPDPVNARPHALTYTIVAVNGGTSGATNAIVRIEFPDNGVSVVGVSGSNGFVCSKNLVVDASGLTWDCKGDFGASGTLTDNTTITADVTVNNAAPDVLKATATVDPDKAIGESDETNNTKSATTTVSGTVCTTPPCIDLVVSDVFDTPDPVANGGSTTYTVSLVNVGDTATNPATVWEMHFLFSGTGTPTVTAPAGVTCAIQFGDPDHIHCKGSSGADPMDLAPGAGITFTVNVTGMATGTASLETIADIFDDIPEFTNANNSVTETTTISP